MENEKKDLKELKNIEIISGLKQKFKHKQTSKKKRVNKLIYIIITFIFFLLFFFSNFITFQYK